MGIADCPGKPQQGMGTAPGCAGGWRSLKKFLGGSIALNGHAIGQEQANNRHEFLFRRSEALGHIILARQSVLNKSFRLHGGTTQVAFIRLRIADGSAPAASAHGSRPNAGMTFEAAIRSNAIGIPAIVLKRLK